MAANTSVASGIVWATDHGARVINVSLGTTAQSQEVCDAVSYALAHQALVVGAAGNNGDAVPFYPAACPGSIGVAATGWGDTHPPWSNIGNPDVFVSAPGVSIYSTYPKGEYALDSGTSLAAAFVSGLAALLVAQSPGRTVAEIKALLASTSDKVAGASYGPDPYGTCAACTWNPLYGYGRIDVDRALQAGSVPLRP